LAQEHTANYRKGLLGLTVKAKDIILRHVLVEQINR